MCRVLFLAMNYNKNLEELLKKLLASFVSASTHDPYLEKLTNGERFCHGDGWGLAAILKVEKNNIVRNIVVYERFSELITIEKLYQYIDKILYILRKSDSGNIYMILHSRATGYGEPIGLEWTHPFREYILNGMGCIWLAHNGVIDKTSIARDLGLSPWIYSDTQLLTKFIARELDKCLQREKDVDTCTKNIYEEIYSRYVRDRQALITGLLIVVQDDVYLYSSTIVKSYEELDDLRKSYYKVYHIYKESMNVLTSSTLVDFYLRDRDDMNIEVLQQVLLRVEPNSIKILKEFT